MSSETEARVGSSSTCSFSESPRAWMDEKGSPALEVLQRQHWAQEQTCAGAVMARPPAPQGPLLPSIGGKQQTGETTM
eukprot:2252081-Alexandrium_andersonii.AAC.1